MAGEGKRAWGESCIHLRGNFDKKGGGEIRYSSLIHTYIMPTYYIRRESSLVVTTTASEGEGLAIFWVDTCVAQLTSLPLPGPTHPTSTTKNKTWAPLLRKKTGSLLDP